MKYWSQLPYNHGNYRVARAPTYKFTLNEDFTEIPKRKMKVKNGIRNVDAHGEALLRGEGGKR